MATAGAKRSPNALFDIDDPPPRAADSLVIGG